MRTRLSLLLSAIGAFLLGCSAASDGPATTPSSPNARTSLEQARLAADNSLGVLLPAEPLGSDETKSAMVNAKVAAQESLSSLLPPDAFPPSGDPPKAGQPIPLVQLKLNELADSPPGGSHFLARRLAAPTAAYVPVVSGHDRIRYIVTARKLDGAAWQGVELQSNPALAAVFKSIASRPSNEQLSGIVRIPGLNLEFEAFGNSEDLRLRALWDAPKYGIQRDVPQPAAKILGVLQDAARKMSQDDPEPKPR